MTLDTASTSTDTAPAAPAAAPDTTPAAAPALETGAAGLTGTEGTAAPAAPAAPTIAEIEAMLDGTPMKLREDLLLPWKRGEESGTAPLREMIASYQQQGQWTKKFQSLAEERRSFESTKLEIETKRREIQAESTAVQREMQRHLEALTSPDESVRQKYERHLEMLAGDPEYRKTYERSLKYEAFEAREGLHTELEQQRYVQSVQADIADAVTRFTTEFSLQEAQIDRVLARYEVLVRQEGEKALTERSLKRLFEEEASYAQTVSTPIKSELDALRAEIAALKSGSQADAHNTRVRTTVTKAAAATAAATPTRGSSTPAIGATNAAPARAQSREDRHKAWMRAG